MPGLLPHRPALTVGLTFVPPGALAVIAPGSADEAGIVASASRHLDAAFAFLPRTAPWAEAAIGPLLGQGTAPFAVFDGPLWPILEERGIETGLRDTLLHPEQIAVEIALRLDAIEAGVRDAIEAGARAIVIAEDLAGTAGPLVAPDFAIEVLLPRLAGIVRQVTEAGLPAVLHSDGDIRVMLGAVKRAGFSAVHAGGGLTFDAFERLFWAARAEELVMIGGMQTRDLAGGLARAEVLGSRVGLLARAGGLLVADDGGITTPAEVVALSTALAAARSAVA